MLKTMLKSVVPAAILSLSILNVHADEETHAVDQVEVPARAGVDLEELFSFLPGVVAVHNDTPITAEEVRNALPPQLVMFLGNGYKLPKEQLEQIALQTLNQLINEKLLSQAATEAGFEPKQEAAEQEVQKIQAQIGEDKFQSGLKHEGLTRGGLVDRFATQMAVNDWIENTIIPSITPSDEEIKAFYEANKSEISVPERVQASHILVKVDEGAKEEIRKAARQKIAALLTQVRDGGNFAELAKENSDCPSSAEGGNLGKMARDATVKPFSDAAFALKKDEISGIVETRFGYHIIKSHGILPAQTSMEELKPEIEKRLIGQKLNERLEAIINEVRVKAKTKILFAATPPADTDSDEQE